MDIIVNTNTIIGVAGLVTAIGVLIGTLYKGFTQISKWESYDKKIDEVKQETKDLKTEQYVQTKVLLAVLDGLHQQGCNGKVTEATVELNDFLNKRAH